MKILVSACLLEETCRYDGEAKPCAAVQSLAEKAELSAQTINDIEGCRTWVSDKSLTKIADALHTTPANLLLTHSCDSSESFDILRFKTELQDSVRQKIEEIFTENMSNLK